MKARIGLGDEPFDEDVDGAGKTHTASRTEYGAFALPVTVIDDEGAALRNRLEVEPKQMMEDAGPTMVAVKAVLTGGVRQSNTMVTVTVEERDEEYLVSPALFELEIPAGETSVDDEFMLLLISGLIFVFRSIAHVAPISDRITVTITAAVAIHA